MKNQVIDAEGEILFEKRMANWRRTVRYLGGSGSGSTCAFWADLYLKSRGEGEVEVDRLPTHAAAHISVEELDGWLVEAAWRGLADFDERQALKYWFVFQRPEHWIKRKLGLRRMGVPMLLARAKLNLKKNLDKFENPVKIHTNNLRAAAACP